MPATPPVLAPVQSCDFEAMLKLRIAALRESLERLGRFDPARARERLAAGFAPQHMHHIEVDGQRVGFVTLRPDLIQQPASLRLDHLYLVPNAQGRGVGSWVIGWAKAQAHRRDIQVSALQHSDANRFYLRHGFVKTAERDFDIDYCWSPEGGVPA